MDKCKGHDPQDKRTPDELRAQVIKAHVAGVGSSREVGKRLNISSTHVLRLLKEARARGEVDPIEEPEWVTGADGRQYPTTRRPHPADPVPISIDWEQVKRQTVADRQGIPVEQVIIDHTSPLQQQLGAKGYKRYVEQIDERRALDAIIAFEQAHLEWRQLMAQHPMPTPLIRADDTLLKFLKYVFPSEQYRAWLFPASTYWQAARVISPFGYALAGLPVTELYAHLACEVEVSPSVVETYAGFALVPCEPTTVEGPQLSAGKVLAEMLAPLDGPLRGVGVLPLYDINTAVAPFDLRVVGRQGMLGVTPPTFAETAPGRIETFAQYRAEGYHYAAEEPQPADYDCPEGYIPAAYREEEAANVATA